VDSCLDSGSSLGGLVSHCIYTFISYETSMPTCYILIYNVMLMLIISLEVVGVSIIFMHRVAKRLAHNRLG
jgi:hypothetical protein